MKIDVTKIKKILGQSFPYHFSENMKSLDLGGETLEIVSPVEFTGVVVNTGQGIQVRGKISITLRRYCGRCLKEFTQPVDSELEVLFKSPQDLVDMEEAPLSQEDFLIYEGNLIDLSDVIQEYLLMALPMKALCSPDCRGICPICGTNLNENSCDCRSDQVDPRLKVLEKLLKS